MCYASVRITGNVVLVGWCDFVFFLLLSRTMDTDELMCVDQYKTFSDFWDDTCLYV